jgi:hypothetical protein
VSLWWVCEAHGDFQRTALSRSKGSRCPTCVRICTAETRSRPRLGQSFGEVHPHFVEQYHPTLNGDRTIFDVSPSSNVRLWWACDDHGDYTRSARDRIRGMGCTECSRLIRKEKLSRPEPGKSLGEMYPQLVPEYHTTRNGGLTIFHVRPGGTEKLWWVCNVHGDFMQAPHNRRAGQGCPDCGKLARAAKRGAPKPGHSLGDLLPNLVDEFHPTLNGATTIFDVAPSSARKLWWLCQDHGEFEQAAVNRKKGCGCTACGRLLASASRSIPTPGRSLGDLFPHLIPEFHPTRNGATTIFDVNPASAKKLWWICANHGDFEQAPEARGKGGRGCQPCGRESAEAAKRVPKAGRSLGDLFPLLIPQFHWTSNGDATIFSFKPSSSTPVWWYCPQHGSYLLTPNQRINGAGCDECAAIAAAKGLAMMTRKRLIILLESFREGLDSFSLSQAQMLTLGVQAGIAKNGAFMQVVNGHSVKALDEAIRTLNGDSGSGDDVVESDAPGDEAALLTGLASSPGVGEEPEAAASRPRLRQPPHPDASDLSNGGLPLKPTAEQRSLPAPAAGAVLRNAGALMAAADSEAARYLIMSSAEQLWKSAYQDPGSADTETADPRDNHFEEQVRAAFRAEFEAARALVPPTGWNFEPLGPGTGVEQPLLMQAHVATQLAERRRIGNWSGTGAGKTVSAILGARLIDAGFGDGVVLVVCPNNTQDGWKSTILNCYPDSRISTGGLNPKWKAGTGPRWMVISYDSLSQPSSAELVRELLSRPDIRVDMVAIDEIHLVKLRGHNGRGSAPVESKRRANLKTILALASEENPELAVLGMSATPLINDLNEARSVLELIAGHEYPDLDTFPNTQNCLKMHQQFVLAGTRFMPDYEAELTEVTPEVDCDHLVGEIRDLGPRPHPSAVERVLLRAKLPVILDECLQAKSRGKRTFVYAHYVDGIIDLVQDELESAGLSVGIFTGAGKDGLARFTGTHSDGNVVPSAERADVLIGSSAISTGVDGLQHVADTLVFAVLPWTAAEREQVVGRVHRTGQRSEKVRSVTPVTVARSFLVPGPDGQAPWSWCRRRLSILTFKQSVADAVLEGVVAKSLSVSPQKASDAILAWIHRLENQGEYVAVRPSSYEVSAA